MQERTFERVGGRKSISTQIRILAATNQDLDQLIAQGRFRSDLYYRLKEITIRVPSLRDRSEDIPELAHHFLFQFAHETGRDVYGFAPDVLDLLQCHSWPGNVRELRSAIKEAAIRTPGQIITAEFLPANLVPGISASSARVAGAARPSDLDAQITSLLNAGTNDLHDHLIQFVERKLITRILQHTHGHLGQACDRLGIDRKTLRNKLQELNIQIEKLSE
ncbi:MAG TPA: sigma 54-interacting transcriptional regulator, partial [Gemmataceae bacterium]|nr:sigma 54-interacting transcriptional regulator [Gemmataceae bacterium]